MGQGLQSWTKRVGTLGVNVHWINRLSPLPHNNVGLNSNGKQTTLHGVGGGGDVNL